MIDHEHEFSIVDIGSPPLPDYPDSGGEFLSSILTQSPPCAGDHIQIGTAYDTYSGRYVVRRVVWVTHSHDDVNFELGVLQTFRGDRIEVEKVN